MKVPRYSPGRTDGSFPRAEKQPVLPSPTYSAVRGSNTPRCAVIPPHGNEKVAQLDPEPLHPPVMASDSGDQHAPVPVHSSHDTVLSHRTRNTETQTVILGLFL